MKTRVEHLFFKLNNVAYLSDSDNCKFTKVRINYNRLRVVVADNSDTRITFESWKNALKFCAEI